MEVIKHNMNINLVLSQGQHYCQRACNKSRLVRVIEHTGKHRPCFPLDSKKDDNFSSWVIESILVCVRRLSGSTAGQPQMPRPHAEKVKNPAWLLGEARRGGSGQKETQNSEKRSQNPVSHMDILDH